MKDYLITAITIVLVLTLILVGIGGIIKWGQTYDEIGVNLGQGWYYPLTTQVVKVDKGNDSVICEDFNGNLWEFKGCEDWHKGDIASLLMNTKGTEKIDDDEIIISYYNGTFEDWK